MKSCLFVSDVHLNHPSDQQWSRFLGFLRGIKDSSEVSDLFLVGDIFDLWIAHHEFFKEKYRVFIEELNRISSLGVKVHYFEGNHDLYLKSYFQNDLGFNVYEGPKIFRLFGKSVRVEHGDQIDPDDKGYLFLRWFLRTGFMKWFARSMPQRWIVSIGNKSSKTSRKYTSQVKTIASPEAIKKIRAHAQSKACQENLDLLISGHLHTRDEFTFKCGNKNVTSVNLGSWFDDNKYYELSEQGVGRFISL